MWNNIFFSIINTSLFASVCLKNDMGWADTIVISIDGGKTWSRKLRMSNIYVSENFVPKFIVKNSMDWEVENLVADNFGNDLEDGDMVHIGVIGNGLPYISWVEKGNCNGRAPT